MNTPRRARMLANFAELHIDIAPLDRAIREMPSDADMDDIALAASITLHPGRTKVDSELQLRESDRISAKLGKCRTAALVAYSHLSTLAHRMVDIRRTLLGEPRLEFDWDDLWLDALITDGVDPVAAEAEVSATASVRALERELLSIEAKHLRAQGQPWSIRYEFDGLNSGPLRVLAQHSDGDQALLEITLLPNGARAFVETVGGMKGAMQALAQKLRETADALDREATRGEVEG